MKGMGHFTAMRSWPVAVVAAIALALPIVGLFEVAGRAGPIDTMLQPETMEAAAVGFFMTRGDTSVLGVCPNPPCAAGTTIDLRIRGLPEVPYAARLVGQSTVHLGPLAWNDDEARLLWTDDEEHADKDRLELLLAGRAIASWSLRGSNVDLGGLFAASWGAAKTPVHLAEIGMITISTIAEAILAESPPDGWVFRAILEGSSGRIDIGELSGDGTILDARVVRIPLEDQQRIVIVIIPAGDVVGPGFPVLAASL